MSSGDSSGVHPSATGSVGGTGIGRSCLAVVLAAGEGTRMRSRTPKVLHRVGGQAMAAHVLRAAAAAGAQRIALVTGHGAEAVGQEMARLGLDLSVFEQARRLGTAHAVLAAREALLQPADDIVVLCGDAPLVEAATIARLRSRLGEGADIAVLGFEAADPTGYGRLLIDGDRLKAIREEKDATAAERAVRLCNSGIIALRGALALPLLEAVGNDNAKGEYYLTDIVEIANRRGLAVVAETTTEDEVQGVNDRAQLARCEAAFQQRARARMLAAGTTLLAPETVFFSFDTVLGRDVIVHQNVVFGPGVTVSDDCEILPFSHLEGAKVGAGTRIGPFARLRPGADLGEGVHVGNFVEVKAARVEDGAKLNHLSYIGDARVGAGSNIGAGTIVCNYDGTFKHHTDIGAGAFIGSNSALVAPVSIGDGAYVGTGSVITDDVPADALAIGRGRQVVKEGRGAEIRAEQARLKAERAGR